VRRVLAFLLLAGAAGCVQRFDATSLGVPVTMGAASGSPTEGTRFQTSSHSIHGMWGLFSISNPNLRKALNRQLIDGAGVADLRIKVRSSWSDLLFTVLTAGLVVPRTVTYEGVIVPPL
jgi:hypothetical protein